MPADSGMSYTGRYVLPPPRGISLHLVKAVSESPRDDEHMCVALPVFSIEFWNNNRGTGRLRADLSGSSISLVTKIYSHFLTNPRFPPYDPRHSGIVHRRRRGFPVRFEYLSSSLKRPWVLALLLLYFLRDPQI